MNFPWRKADRNAPESTYIRLLQPGDVFYIPGQRIKGEKSSPRYQVETAPKPWGLAMTTVKLVGMSKAQRFANWDRCRLVFRFAKPESVETLV